MTECCKIKRNSQLPKNKKKHQNVTAKVAESK